MFQNNPNRENQLSLYRSLFKGREDVFAKYWRSGNKSGYMPAYQFDPYLYRLHKMKGGSFANFNDKTYLPFTDQQLKKHLNGEQLIKSKLGTFTTEPKYYAILGSIIASLLIIFSNIITFSINKLIRHHFGFTSY